MGQNQFKAIPFICCCELWLRHLVCFRSQALSLSMSSSCKATHELSTEILTSKCIFEVFINIKHRISSDYSCLESSRFCLHWNRGFSAAPVLTRRHQEAEILTSPFADCSYPRSTLLSHHCVLRWCTTRKQNNIWFIIVACKKQPHPFYQGKDADFYITRYFVGKWAVFLIKALFLVWFSCSWQWKR